MIRFCSNCVKHTVWALLLLIVIPCVVEVGMRVYQFRVQRIGGDIEANRLLVKDSISSHHQLTPLFHIRVKNRDTGVPVTIATNSFGLRGIEPTVPKPPGTYRIICLGDENVLGPEIAEDRLFCSRLHGLLQSEVRLRVEVLNAGVPGYSPLLSYLQLKHRLLALQPDLLILNFDMSDVAEDYRYRRRTVMDDSGVPLACPATDRQPHNRSQTTRLADQFLLVRWCRDRLATVWESRTEPETRQDITNAQARYAWITDAPPDWSVYIRHTLSEIDYLRTLADGINAQLILATYPVPWQVSPVASNGAGVRQRAGVPEDAVYTSDAPFQILAEFAKRRQLIFCNATPVFRNTPNPDRLYLKNAPRFSEAGHDLYAQQLARCIVGSIFRQWNRPAQAPSRFFPGRAGGHTMQEGPAHFLARPSSEDHVSTGRRMSLPPSRVPVPQSARTLPVERQTLRRSAASNRE